MYGFINHIIYSSNIKNYPKMIGEGFRRALIYLLLFTLIFGTIKGITTGVYWGKEYKNIMETIINKLPDFYVKMEN